MPKASGKRRRVKRSTREYLDSAADLARFVPHLKKLKRRKTLKRGEKVSVTYWSKKLRYLPNLIPLTKKQAKELRNQLISPKLQAIQLTNVGKVEKITVVNKKMFVAANHRTFLYTRVDDLTQTENRNEVETTGMYKEAGKAFDQMYPIEQIMKLAELAFKSPQTEAIYLWSDQGNVGEPFYNLNEFVQWLLTDYSKYRNVHKWVNGIAIMLEDANASPAKKAATAELLKAERREARKRRRFYKKHGYRMRANEKVSMRKGRKT